MTPEATSRIESLRREALTRELTPDEMRETVKLLREGRLAAHHASENSRKKSAKVAIPDANDLLDELMKGDGL